MLHEPRLQQSLHHLLTLQRTATLAVQPLADFSSSGYLPAPWVALVPWAWNAEFGCLVLLLSRLARHTAALEKHSAASLLVSAAPQAGEGVHGLERVSLEGVVSFPPQGSVLAQSMRPSYLARFPEAESISLMPDFHFACLTVTSACHVAGFGTVRDLSAVQVGEAMNLIPG